MSVTLDTRPIHVLLARKGWPFAALTLVAAAGWWAVLQQPPEGLSTAGWHALVVFGICLLLWLTQLLPLAVTALLGLALLPLLDVLPPVETYALFGNPAVFFILGAFMLAAGAIKTGLSEHLALALLESLGTGPRQLLLAMLIIPACMAFFMPEHAVVAVFLPIAWEIVRGLDLRPGNRYAQAIFLATAWGAIIGGVATLLGGARGPLAMALVHELTGRSFSFLDWTLAATPVVLAMLVVAGLLLVYTTSAGEIDIGLVRSRIERRQLENGALGWQGRVMALLMGTTVGAWIFSGYSLGLASIALVSVVFMFSLRLVSWKDVQAHVSWDVVMLYGGAIAIGKAVAVTGAGAWIASRMLPFGLSGMGLLLLLVLVTLLLTEGVSNVAAVAIMLPVAIPFALNTGMDPVAVSLATGIMAGFAFMLPMGTPPNAMIYSTGYVSPGAMLRYGAVMSASAFCLFALTAWLWWPLAGIDLGLSG